MSTKIKYNIPLKNGDDFTQSHYNHRTDEVYEGLGDTRGFFDQDHSVPQRLAKIAEFFTINDVASVKTGLKAGIYIHDSKTKIKQLLLYKDVEIRARNCARQLLSANVKRGDVVALLATTSIEFVVAFMACQFLGALPSLLPTTIHLGGREFFVNKISGMLQLIEPQLILYEKSYETFFENVKNISLIDENKFLTYEELKEYPSKTIELVPFRNDENFNIQFSSGSTSTPKAILIKQKALMSNIYYSSKRMGCHLKNTIAVSWLPFYHDMGFIGVFLLSIIQGISLFCFEPAVFARNPLLWLQLISRYRASLTVAPNFSYDLVTRRYKVKAGCNEKSVREKIGDLSSLRIVGVGSEMVNYSVIKKFINTFEPMGFNPKSISPGYGMAEATLLITVFDYEQRGLKVDCVDRQKLQNDNIALPVKDGEIPNYKIVSCGRVIDNHKIRIIDEKGKILPERRLGNVEFYGDSIMSGYYKDCEATKKVITKDGYLRTGDIGYIANGELFITGRKKEIIIHNGRNISPSELEYEIIKTGNYRINDVVAFSVLENKKDEEIVIIAHNREYAENIPALRKKIAATVYKICGASCKIIFIKPGQIPVTTSGKLSRMPARKIYLQNQFIVSPGSEI